jgi:three-Cys-motif partner protein
MMATNDLDVIGSWSEVKLDILKDYASAYSRILASQTSISRHLYIDAFAGAGIHVSKATGEFVAGSPFNAMLVNPPFSEMHWIDLDHARVEGLQQLAEGNETIFVHHGNCNEVLLNTVFPRCRWEDYARALCILDPYGLNVDWRVLETAGRMRTVEVFYNFMIMDANMNVLLRDPRQAQPGQIARMNAVWGDESWRDAGYRKQQRGLYDDEFVEEKASNQQLVKRFQARLRDVAGFRYVPDPIPMKNSSGATVYYLFFASHNSTAKKIVEAIFKKHAPRAAYGK